MNYPYQNDLSLLREFNLEAAKNGEEICWSALSDKVTFIGVTNGGVIAYESGDDSGFTSSAQFRMKPLCWVEGKPVYNGDVLYWGNGTSHPGWAFTVSGPMICNGSLIAGDTYSEGKLVYAGNDGSSGMLRRSLTWNKPKQKVKRKVWINVYPDEFWASGYYSKESADTNSMEGRAACVETEIEYEV